MTAPRRLIIRPFGPRDPAQFAELLRAASPEYVRFFHPFAFEEKAIADLASAAVLDQWFALEIEQGGSFRPAGCYSLRGLDEGYPEPMYGVFIAEEFRGRGLARLTLVHAEAQCRLNGWPALLLKVDPANTRAFRLYEQSGFRFLRPSSSSDGQHVMKKHLTDAPASSPL